MFKNHARRGFTLVELLVVIAIIGILIGMLLPAVQQVREAARRTECLNHLRQNGLAVLNYESANRRFPSSGANRGAMWGATWDYGASKPTTNIEIAGSFYQILPFLEQTSVAQLRSGYGPYGVYPMAVPAIVSPLHGEVFSEMTVPTYNCPSRAGERFLTMISEGGLRFALTDYASFFLDQSMTEDLGPGTDADLLPAWQGSGTMAFQWDNAPEEQDESKHIWVGIIAKGGHLSGSSLRDFRKQPRVTFASVRDGASNTMVYAESGARSVDYHPVDNISLRDGQFDASNWACVRGWAWGKKIHSDSDDTGFNQQEEGFGSPHPGTCSVLLGDGSTRSVSKQITVLEFYKLGARSDSLVLDLSGL